MGGRAGWRRLQSTHRLPRPALLSPVPQAASVIARRAARPRMRATTKRRGTTSDNGRPSRRQLKGTGGAGYVLIRKLRVTLIASLPQDLWLQQTSPSSRRGIPSIGDSIAPCPTAIPMSTIRKRRPNPSDQYSQPTPPCVRPRRIRSTVSKRDRHHHPLQL